MSLRGARHLGAWLTVPMIASGCASLEAPHHRHPDARAITPAYEEGVRDGAARLASEREAGLGTRGPAPLVQEVWMPARVVEGVLIPAHREWVVIDPPGWRRSPAREQGARPAATGSGERGPR